MAYELNPKIGEFAVFAETWRGHAVEVTKVTAKSLNYKLDGSNRETRGLLTGFVFSGPKDVANKLAEQLKSSYALCNEEVRNAKLRRAERDRKIIEKAAP